MSSLSGSRVLVTGASGLIGSHVVRLLDGRAEIVAVSRADRPDRDGMTWLTRDLASPGTITALLREIRPDVVIHLAGAVRGDRALAAVAPTLQVNLLSTVELLESATRIGSERVVLSGSLLEEPAVGGPDLIPPSPYGASRWAASAYGRMFSTLFETPVVTLRPSFVYGPGQEPTKLVPHVAIALLEGRSPELSSGERLLDFVYAEDVARAYIRAASAPGIVGRTIDIGRGSQCSVRAVVEMIVEAVGPSAGRPVFGRLQVRPHEQEVEADVEEAMRGLGWRATTSLEDGLRTTVDWYRGNLVRAPTGMVGRP